METVTQTALKASDLRIGNWVNNYKGGPVKITATGIKIADIEEDFFNPIPLTPEILEKCGFEWDIVTKRYWNSGPIEISLIKQTANIGRDTFILEFHHLHQLQNLYFALTGIELEISL